MCLLVVDHDNLDYKKILIIVSLYLIAEDILET